MIKSLGYQFFVIFILLYSSNSFSQCQVIKKTVAESIQEKVSKSLSQEEQVDLVYIDPKDPEFFLHQEKVYTFETKWIPEKNGYEIFINSKKISEKYFYFLHGRYLRLTGALNGPHACLDKLSADFRVDILENWKEKRTGYLFFRDRPFLLEKIQSSLESLKKHYDELSQAAAESLGGEWVSSELREIVDYGYTYYPERPVQLLRSTYQADLQYEVKILLDGKLHIFRSIQGDYKFTVQGEKKPQDQKMKYRLLWHTLFHFFEMRNLMPEENSGMPGIQLTRFYQNKNMAEEIQKILEFNTRSPKNYLTRIQSAKSFTRSNLDLETASEEEIYHLLREHFYYSNVRFEFFYQKMEWEE